MDPNHSPIIRHLIRVLGADPTLSEWYSSANALVWAVVLLWPATDTLGSSPSYSAMRWLPEAVWGLLFLGYFIFCVWAWRSQSDRCRRIATLSGVFIWLSLTALLVRGNPATTGWVYVIPACAAALGAIQLRVRREIREQVRRDVE